MERVVLRVVEGPMREQNTQIDIVEPRRVVIGRGADCALVLMGDEQSVSRQHCVIDVVAPPVARLADLGSKNGTVLNGKPLGAIAASGSGQLLAHEDLIRIGPHAIRVEITRAVECLACGGIASNPAWNAASLTESRAVQCPSCGVELTLPAPLATDRPVAAQVSSVPTEPMTWDRFAIEQRLGEGAVGVVDLARDKVTGRMVAIKTLQPRWLMDSGVGTFFEDLFAREIDVTMQLRHPNVVRCLGRGWNEQSAFLVLELLRGGDLANMCAAGAPLATSIALMRDVLRGMAYAHRVGVVHRDIKPGNILLTAAEGGVAKVADLGMGKLFARSGDYGLTITGTAGFRGTRIFASPQQVASAKYSLPDSDVYSLGCTFFALLANTLPYEGWSNSNEAMVRQAIEQGRRIPLLQIRRDVPAWLARAIDRAVSPDPQVRQTDASVFLAEFECGSEAGAAPGEAAGE